MIIEVKTIDDSEGGIKQEYNIHHHTDEKIYDFHFFVLSIACDLLANKFKISEYGQFTYDFDGVEREETYDNLQKMMLEIYEEKQNLNNELDDLLK